MQATSATRGQLNYCKHLIKEHGDQWPATPSVVDCWCSWRWQPHCCRCLPVKEMDKCKNNHHGDRPNSPNKHQFVHSTQCAASHIRSLICTMMHARGLVVIGWCGSLHRKSHPEVALQPLRRSTWCHSNFPNQVEVAIALESWCFNYDTRFCVADIC